MSGLKSLLDVLLESIGVENQSYSGLDNGFSDVKKKLCWLSHDSSVYRTNKLVSAVLRTPSSTVRSYQNQLVEEGRLEMVEFVWDNTTCSVLKSKGGAVVGYAERLIELDPSRWKDSPDFYDLRRYTGRKLSSSRVKGFKRSGEPSEGDFDSSVLEFFVNAMDFGLRRREAVDSKKMSANGAGHGVVEHIPSYIDDGFLKKVFPMSSDKRLIDVDEDKISETQPCFVKDCREKARITDRIFRGSLTVERDYKVFEISRVHDAITIDEKIRRAISGVDVNSLHVPIFECGGGHLSPFMLDGLVAGFRLGKKVSPHSLLERFF